jgi:hypothetical protein
MKNVCRGLGVTGHLWHRSIANAPQPKPLELPIPWWNIYEGDEGWPPRSWFSPFYKKQRADVSPAGLAR